jgi:hypothetical protein
MNFAFYWSCNNRSKKGLPHMACFLYRLGINLSPGNEKEQQKSINHRMGFENLEAYLPWEPKHLHAT